jgi:uncharacterized protein YprB with RNaseH-like and TPR domain
MATLDRLRDIVRQHRQSAVPVVSPELPAAAEATSKAFLSLPDYTRAALALGGAVVERTEGSVIVVDREYRADALHGRTPVGEIVTTINEGADALRLMSKAWPSAAGIVGAGESDDQPLRSRLLFLDLETTGLFGGAGTQAFLIGCASIEGQAIRVRQFLMPGFEHERAVLNEFEACAKSQDSLCTYNGRSFDVPLIETRFMYHRAPCPMEGRPHLDMLHAARRLWRQRPAGVGPDPDDSSCSLGVLEKHIAGLHRIGDVPGYEIPSRFFAFVRNGDPGPLEAVLEHNRLDLISLAAVLARAIVLITRGPSAAATAQEAYGLARVYERGGNYEDAEAALVKTIDVARRVGAEPEVHAEALRRLAWIRRRDRRPHEAAEAWNELAVLPRCGAALRREAKEALAIHHEHRLKDLEAARQHALDLLSEGVANPGRVRHRLDRLERKLARFSEAMLPLN